jgi:predicted transcriptional regulator
VLGDLIVAKRKQAASASSSRSNDRLPDAELDVLACLWRRGEATASEVREMMRRYRPMAHGSVATLLSRLLAKGLVAREKASVGKAFVYQPTRQARSGYRRVVRDVVDRVFGGNSVALVASLFETRPPDAEEVHELQKLLDGLRTKQGRAEQ